jgi:hypothetical protein
MSPSEWQRAAAAGATGVGRPSHASAFTTPNSNTPPRLIMNKQVGTEKQGQPPTLHQAAELARDGVVAPIIFQMSNLS